MVETLLDKWLANFYGKVSMDEFNLLARSARTIEGNFSRGDRAWAPLKGIRPSCTKFEGIWNWDSAFHAKCRGFESLIAHH